MTVTATDDPRVQAELARLGRLDGFRHDPAGFVEWAFPWAEEDGPLGAHAGPQPWQDDILARIGEGLREKRGPVRIAVASGHGVGKSALVAWLALWALSTDPGTRGVVTANTETQLRTKSWAELAKWHRLALSRDCCALQATALVSVVAESEQGGRIDRVPWNGASPEAFAGLHNQGGRLLLVFDEASAIADPVWETAEGALTDSGTELVWLAFGNPTRRAGRFFECFNRFRDRWSGLHVDSRSVALTDKRQLDEWIRDYGADSDFAKVRVLGQFPQAGSMQFIPADLVEEARRRPPNADADRHQPLVMGVDVARFGDDRSVIALRRGGDARSLRFEKHAGLDLMTLASRVAERAAAERVAAVFVDEGGLGAGVVDRLRQLGVPKVFGVAFAGAAQRFDDAGAKPRYANKRAEIWGNLKEWLGHASLPDDAELAADLTGIEYGYNARGEIQLEKKDDMKKRGLASPDIADALALTFALPTGAFGWDLPEPQAYCDTEYDLYRDFDEDDPRWKSEYD